MLQTVLYFLFLIILVADTSGNPNENVESSPLINGKIYSSIFVRRREEQKTLLDHLKRTESYERKYKLLQVGFSQILTVLRDNREKLINENYSVLQGFPKTTTAVDAFSLVVENTCLFGDLLLYTPDMSKKILARDKEWREVIEWGMDFVSNFNNVIDPKSTQMLFLLDQEINIEKRTNDFINPYQEQPESTHMVTKRIKQKKKLKRGPHLHSTEL